MNPRYKAYLQTTSEPTNWGFMEFIGKMVRAYCMKKYGAYDILTSNISDHDDFTAFIEMEVANV